MERSPTDATDAAKTHALLMRLQNPVHLSCTHRPSVVDRIERCCQGSVTVRALEPFHTVLRLAVFVNPLMVAEGAFHLGFLARLFPDYRIPHVLVLQPNMLIALGKGIPSQFIMKMVQQLFNNSMQ